MRVVTQNLWGVRGDWEARRGVLIAGFSELRPDVVAFIEAIKTDEYDQVVDLLGSEYQVAHQSEREPDGQGASIASRWPIGQLDEIDIHVTPRTADFACTTLVTEILAPERFAPLVFANHVPNWSSTSSASVSSKRLPRRASSRSSSATATRTSFLPATSPPTRRRRTSASSQGISPWTARASVTATRGRACIPASRARPSRPTIRSSPTGTGRFGGSTTFLSAAGSTAGRHSRSPRASGSSTTPWTAFGRAITSASTRISRFPLEDRHGRETARDRDHARARKL